MSAALDLVAERGVAGATIEAISARSGVAKTTIYRQWPHQAALVLDAFHSVTPDPPAARHRHAAGTTCSYSSVASPKRWPGAGPPC